MRYQKISRYDTANGLDIGVVLWVSGCPHHCPGCHNQVTWEPTSGQEFTAVAMREVIEALDSPYVNRLTLSGGDPLAPYNRDATLRVARDIKTVYHDKSIWCYTGYTWDQVCDLPIMQYLDVLVDGRYMSNLRDARLPFMGSYNQRVINVPLSLQEGSIHQIETS